MSIADAFGTQKQWAAFLRDEGMGREQERRERRKRAAAGRSGRSAGDTLGGETVAAQPADLQSPAQLLVEREAGAQQADDDQQERRVLRASVLVEICPDRRMAQHSHAQLIDGRREWPRKARPISRRMPCTSTARPGRESSRSLPPNRSPNSAYLALAVARRAFPCEAIAATPLRSTRRARTSSRSRTAPPCSASATSAPPPASR